MLSFTSGSLEAVSSGLSEILISIVTDMVGPEYLGEGNIGRYTSDFHLNSHTDYMVDGAIILTEYPPKMVQVGRNKYEFVQEYKLYS